MHSHTSPKQLTPEFVVAVRSQRTGANTTSVVRGLGVEVAAVLGGRAGGGRLQAIKLAAADQDQDTTLVILGFWPFKDDSPPPQGTEDQ